MLTALQALFDSESLSPHGICLLWRPELIWLHVISDAILALSYFSIPFVLALFVTRRSDVQFGWVFWAFAIFILACGTTHVLGIWTLFYPDYAVEGVVKAITAAASLFTAIGLLPLLPRALAIPSRSQLRNANEALQAQISEREAAVAALKREQDERAKTEEKLRQALKMDAVGKLTAGVAHDFNNLLTVVAGGLERAKRKLGDNPAVLQALAMSEEGARRAALLTKHLLAFGRKTALAPKVTTVDESLEGTVDTLQRALGEQIRIIANLPREPWSIVVDVQELQSAILNLGFNARDAMPDGGTIVISTRNVSAADPLLAHTELPGGDFIEIAVSDTGAGMAPEVVAHAFDPFFTTKPVGEGSGLGLSQVYGFAHQSGGTALIESEPGKGTTVRILLPRAAALAEPASGGQQSPAGPVLAPRPA